MNNKGLENPYKVRLVDSGNRRRNVSFDASPVISESRAVNYNSYDPIHAPGQMQIYKNTQSRSFQVSDIKLISRTIKEADESLTKLWVMRGWCMPRFGAPSSSLSSDQRNNRIDRYNGVKYDYGDMSKLQKQLLDSERYGYEVLGAPPPVLLFNAYSRNINSRSNTSKQFSSRNSFAQHINNVPVVITNFNISYPNDVDYITTSTQVPMATIMSVDLTLVETHSPNEYERFSLGSFRKGILRGF